MATKQKELGTTGLTQWSGVIQQDFLKEFHGNKAYKKFEEMRLNSPVVGALLTAIEHSVRYVDWTFASELGDEDPRLQLLNDSLDMMSHSLNDHIVECLTFLPFGHSIFELVYQRDGGRILWRKFAFRGQDTVYRWLFQDDGGLAGFEQATSYGMLNTVTIPIEKLLLYRTRVERNNPEGRSILRTAWKSYYFAKNIEVIEAIGIERDLAGLPMITLPDGADPTESDSDDTDYGRALRIVRRIRNDEQAGLVMPAGWEFQLASTQGSRLFDTNAIISRHEKRILMSVLAQFLVLGMDQIGALALSEDQTDFFNMSVNATADIITETFNKYAIPRLMRLNGLDADGLRLEHSPAGDVNVEMFTKSLQQATGLITWMPEDEITLRAMLGLPEKTVDEIEQAREEEHQRKMEAMPQFPPPSTSPPKGKEGGEDELTAQSYAADLAPDDTERRQMERKWLRTATDFFGKQRRRVIRAARGLKR